MRRLGQKSEKALGRVATRATRWIGSTNSILVHTALFIMSFVLYFFGVDLNKILLVLTTIVSLEAIYLSIFIQMSVNKQAAELDEVAQDVEEIQEDVDEIQKDDELDLKRDEIMLSKIEGTLQILINEINDLKKGQDQIKNKQ